MTLSSRSRGSVRSSTRSHASSRKSSPLRADPKRKKHLKEVMLAQVRNMYHEKTKKKISPEQERVAAAGIDHIISSGSSNYKDLIFIVKNLAQNESKLSIENENKASKKESPSPIHSGPTSSRSSRAGDLQHNTEDHAVAPRKRKKNQDDLWAKLVDKDVEKYFQEQKRYHVQCQETKKKQKQELDEQVKLKQKLIEKEKESDRKYAEHMLSSIEEWQRTNQCKEQEKLQRILEEKRFRQQQLEETERKRRLEIEEQKRRDAEEYKKLQREIKEAQEKEWEKRMKAKEDLKRIMDLNASLKKERDEMEKRELEADRKLQDDMRKKLHEEEEKRLLELKKRDNLLKQSLQAETRLANDLRAKEQEEDRKLAAQMRKQAEDDAAREKEEKERKKKHHKELAQSWLQHIEWQRKQKERERHEKVRERQLVAEQVKEAERAELLQHLKHKESEVKSCMELQKQIQAKCKKEPSMTELERKLNKSLL